MKRIVFGVLLVIIGVLFLVNHFDIGDIDNHADLSPDLYSNTSNVQNSNNQNKNMQSDYSGDKSMEETIVEETSVSSEWKAVNPSGNTIVTRFPVPKHFHRVEATASSFSEFVRNYPLKADGEPVHLYNQTEKYNQKAHVAVFDMPVVAGDLQQCADSVMRIYAEFYYSQNEYDKISFHFVNGFQCDFKKWLEGYRVKVSGNTVTWNKKGMKDDSYKSFEAYLRTVFSYASTMSMKLEVETKDIKDVEIGDVFLYAGSPGHVVMVVDVCEDEEGNKAFLLAQGYMPAQEFHILTNPCNDKDPWYYVKEMTYPLQTPEYAFDEGTFYALKY